MKDVFLVISTHADSSQSLAEMYFKSPSPRDRLIRVQVDLVEIYTKEGKQSTNLNDGIFVFANHVNGVERNLDVALDRIKVLESENATLRSSARWQRKNKPKSFE